MLETERGVAAISGVFPREAEIHRRFHGTMPPEFRQVRRRTAFKPAFRV
jgi:hypothetical protein